MANLINKLMLFALGTTQNSGLIREIKMFPLNKGSIFSTYSLNPPFIFKFSKEVFLQKKGIIALCSFN